MFEVAGISFTSKLNEGLVVLVKKKPVFGSVNAELVQRRTHLRGEGKIGCGSLCFSDNDSQLIDHFGFTYPS